LEDSHVLFALARDLKRRGVKSLKSFDSARAGGRIGGEAVGLDGKGGTVFDVVYLRNGPESVKEMKPKVLVASRASFAKMEKGGMHKVRK
jgi:hypothetical protein